ncbi:GTP pyrophosphokinase [Paeniglutamicibacter sp. R2-26]|uniref:GTP pyrophosphokinase n=1 Tax=Paeniglutamicibacter sp. R2-26 TaxID=3144417 RepID=UPI003EE7BE56
MSNSHGDADRRLGIAPDVQTIPTHVWNYAQDQGELADAARDIRRYLEELAELGSIPIYAIESRAKSLASYQKKANKKGTNGDPKYSDPASQITDCVAARVIVFTTRARHDLAELIESHANVVERQNPGYTKHNGYDSEHLVVSSLRNSEALARHVALGRYFAKYPGLEIQIRSVAGHAWAEYEHDIRYKSGAYQELSADGKSQIDQWFVEAGGMRRVMDELFGLIEDRLTAVEADALGSPGPGGRVDDSEEGFAEDPTPRHLDAEMLGDFITRRFPDQKRGDPAAISQLLDHLHALNVSTVAKLNAELANVEAGHVAWLMDYPGETSGVRRLDDELLAVFTDQYVTAAESEERKQFLRLRLRRVRGKFAIYSVGEGADPSRRLVTAAKAVRETARLVANIRGRGAVVMDGAVALGRGDLMPSTNAVMVKTGDGPIHVATNLTRSWAETVMCELVGRTPGSSLRVFRSGDLLVESPPGTGSETGTESPGGRN